MSNAIEKPKWNHWLRKRQLWDQKKKQAPFDIGGNVPQAFKDALKAKAADKVEWDFQTALGETVKEKHSSEYVKIVEITNVVNRKPLPNKNNDIFVTCPLTGIRHEIPFLEHVDHRKVEDGNS